MCQTLPRLLLLGFLLASPPALASTIVVEPDGFTEGAVLNDAEPAVDLRVFDAVLEPNFPTGFGVFPDPDVIPVTATTHEDIFGGFFTSTGTKVFAHAEIPHFNETRQLAMRFPTPAQSLSIDAIGTSDLSATVGRLEVFSASGQFLQSVTTPQLFSQDVATLSITRPTADIGFARAFSEPGFDLFGALDNLRFDLAAEDILGDLDGDGDVDAADVNRWRIGFGSGTLGDADEDGDTDVADVMVLQREFTGPEGVAASTLVPEPGAFALVGLLAGVLASSRHR